MINTKIKHMEELSINAHPPLKTMFYDGWYLFFSGGYTNRANSVNMLNESILPIEEKVAFCDRVYEKEGRPTVFKITPLSIDLDDMLKREGYSLVTVTNIWTMNIPDYNKSKLSSEVKEGISNEWQYEHARLSEMDKNAVTTASKIREKINNTALCALTAREGESVACGLCVVENEYAGLFDIMVAESYRRQGIASDLISSLLCSASSFGAKKAYLQVVDDNTRAKELYTKLGFTPCYQYWYRVKER